MANIIHTRSAKRSLMVALVVLFTVQGLLPCQSLCDVFAVPDESAKPATAESPACHAAATEPTAHATANITYEAPKNSQCCCIVLPNTAQPTETSTKPIVRDSTRINAVAAVVTEVISPTQYKSVPAPNHAASPPGAPLFIAHHSLLI